MGYVGDAPIHFSLDRILCCIVQGVRTIYGHRSILYIHIQRDPPSSISTDSFDNNRFKREDFKGFFLKLTIVPILEDR